MFFNHSKIQCENLFFQMCFLICELRLGFFKDNDSHNLDVVARHWRNGRRLSSSFLRNRTNSMSGNIHKSHFIAERKCARAVGRGQRKRKRISESD